ncbi:hypothetical protein N9I00_00645 [bacterium]|nr:hypothetical protein [bacterium]
MTLTKEEIMEVVEEKLGEVHDLVYDNMPGLEGKTHPVLVEMWEVLEKLKKIA